MGLNQLKQLENLAIVLIRPKYPENVGFVARTALNMGISHLLVVCEERPDRERMMTTATHNARPIIEAISYFLSLSEALAEFHLAVGTTARTGRGRRPEVLPADLAKLLAPVLGENKVAIVFGPEDRGLTNDELQLCGLVSSITTAGFSSLNLSHAVAVYCYEIFQGLSSFDSGTGPFAPKLATVREQESMFADLDILLARMDELSGKEKGLRRRAKLVGILGRRTLQAKETRLISEICRELGSLLDS